MTIGATENITNRSL